MSNSHRWKAVKMRHKMEAQELAYCLIDNLGIKHYRETEEEIRELSSMRLATYPERTFRIYILSDIIQKED